MKKSIKKWSIRITSTVLFIGGLLLGIILNPSLLYAHKTSVGNYTIYHHSNIDQSILLRLQNMTSLLKKSELYNPNLQLDICLNDGSNYPKLIEKIHGKAFALGFYNKIVLHGHSNPNDNHLELNGYLWNLEQLLAHEAIHCYQYDTYGFWNSNPIANHAQWKWEGYPEYIARQNQDQRNLGENINRLLKNKELQKNSWSISFSDDTISPIKYYEDWLLVQYCLDIKRMSYDELLKDLTPKEDILREMFHWFNKTTVN